MRGAVQVLVRVGGGGTAGSAPPAPATLAESMVDLGPLSGFESRKSTRRVGRGGAAKSKGKGLRRLLAVLQVEWGPTD